MVSRFLVGVPPREWPYGRWFLVEAESHDSVAEQFSGVEQLVVTDLQRERPGWLTDSTLAALSAHSLFRLGDPEPSWLTNLLDHLLNGDTYRWYRLCARRNGDPAEHRMGDFGTWHPKGPGSVLLLGRKMVVTQVRPAEAPFDGELVLVAA